MKLPTVCVTSSTYASFAEDRDRIAALVEEFTSTVSQPHQADLHIHVGTPNCIGSEVRPVPGVRFVLYSFAEATRIPAEWSAALNICDEVWVPSRFVRDAFLESGVTRPVRVIPLGIDCSGSTESESRAESTRPFTFMWQGTNLKSYRNGKPVDGDRKRGLLVESAFRRANIPNSRLILKYLPTAGFEYQSRVDPVWYICSMMSAKDVTQLDRQVDAFIWPTMGEGFGKLPLEKLAAGIPAFATYWSGVTEYLGDFGLRKLVPDRIIDVRFNGIQTQMADVTEDQVVEILRYCVQDRAALAEQRDRLRSIAREKWDFRRTMKLPIEAALTALA